MKVLDKLDPDNSQNPRFGATDTTSSNDSIKLLVEKPGNIVEVVTATDVSEERQVFHRTPDGDVLIQHAFYNK